MGDGDPMLVECWINTVDCVGNVYHVSSLFVIYNKYDDKYNSFSIKAFNIFASMRTLIVSATKQEVKFLEGELKKPASIVEACQWLSSTKLLNEEFVKREKPLRTAIELCPDVPEIQSLQNRSKALKKQVEIYLAKVT